MRSTPSTTLNLHSILSLLTLLSTSASAALTTPGSTVTLDGTAYYVPPTSVGTVQLNGRPIWPGWGFGGSAKLGAGLLPMTVVTGPSGFDAMSVANGFGAVDDVWAQGFMEGMSYRLKLSYIPCTCKLTGLSTVRSVQHHGLGSTIDSSAIQFELVSQPFHNQHQSRLTTSKVERLLSHHTRPSFQSGRTSSTAAAAMSSRPTDYTLTSLALSPRPRSLRLTAPTLYSRPMCQAKPLPLLFLQGCTSLRLPRSPLLACVLESKTFTTLLAYARVMVTGLGTTSILLRMSLQWQYKGSLMLVP